MSMRGAEGNGATDAKDRRAGGGQRVHFEALVAVGENGGGGFEAESVDVSPDGMRLRTAYLPEVGDKLVCRFDGMGHEIVVEGEVTWRNEEAKGGEFGLRFTGLDAASEDAVKAMCAELAGPPAEERAEEEEPAVPRGSRVRLHIEGLGSPMKARVRESAAREVEVGSNLEFLKVGRTLELEDVEAGAKREATIDGVKVDVDPSTNVPQLVVTLRYDKLVVEKVAAAPAKKKEKARASEPPPATRRAGSTPPEAPSAKSEIEAAPKTARKSAPPPPAEAEASANEAEADEHAEDDEKAGLERFGARAANAGRAVASKIGPAINGMSAGAKRAMGGMMALIERRRAAQAEQKKASAPRRTTAPPPAGAITVGGRRLVRDEGLGEEEDAPRPRTNHRAAALGGGLGLIAVLAIFGVTRLIAGRGHATADAHATPSALPAATAEAPVAVASGTPVANVPLFGATPLSTTEPLAPPASSAQASAAPSAPAMPGADGVPGASDQDDEAGDAAANGPILKEWGQGSVGTHPVVLRIKMDGAIERITGSAGAQGFTINVPGRRSISTARDMTRKDKRLSSVNVVNTSHGAEISVQFKHDVPSYQARVKGEKLEIAIAKAEHSRVAKKKSSKGKKKRKHH